MLVRRIARGLSAVREPMAIFAATRLPLVLMMYLSLVLMPLGDPPPNWRVKPDNLFLDGWFRWDSAWYHAIAEKGYDNALHDQGQRDTSFWPLFPLLTRALVFICRTDDPFAVMFCLNLGLLAGSAFFLYEIAKARFGVDAARLATVLFLTYPYGIYYSAGYSEATYLFFTVGTFYFGMRERWAAASLMSALATASRGVGVTTALGVVVLYLEKCSFSLRRVRKDALWLPLSAAGAALYSFYLWRRFGDPFAYVQSYTARGWGAEVTWPRFVDTLLMFVRPDRWPPGKIPIPDMGCLVAFLGVSALTLVGARRLSVAETVFSLSSLFVYAKMWPTSGRYVGTIFPIYFTLAELVRLRPAWRVGLTTTFAVLLALFAVVFGHWGWLSG
jgi:hypothetical protein